MPITIQAPFTQDSYDRLIQSLGGEAESAFIAITTLIANRYFSQLDLQSPSPAFIQQFLAKVWATLQSESLPTPLLRSEIGAPEEPDYAHLNSLAEKCLSSLPKHRTEDQLRQLTIQLFIALLSPEFRTCRQSYLTPELDDTCLRQQQSHCLDRISGSHCEDCPYFVALTAQQNEKLLKRVWKSDHSLQRHKKVFVPEDFRSLRVFWHLYLRRNQ